MQRAPARVGVVMNLEHYRESIELYGVGRTAYHAGYRVLNHVTPLAVWKALRLVLGDVSRGFLTAARREGATVLDATALLPHADDPETRLTRSFLDAAAEKRDRCVAFFEDGRLLSYGFYATRPTRLVELDAGLVLHFDPSWVYMYNGFTVKRARGRRLHAYGMAHALEVFTADGSRGLVSYIDSSNFASLRSSHRLGFRNVGYLVMMKVGDHYACAATSGCKPYGLRVRQEPS